MGQRLPRSWRSGHPTPTCAIQERALAAAQAAHSLLPTPQCYFYVLKVTYPHSPSQPFRCLLLPQCHWGFLLQELGAGNSKRDSSLGAGVSTPQSVGRPTSGPTELHWDSSLSLSLGQITQQNHVGILVLFFIYISIKRILICMSVVCSGESRGPDLGFP